ncbi:unnamed protein product [Phytophthora lilii]|uniref:Unnamed protein product n=1 Tax=Phytophthora lilii TaxID=2077276 RepID=A0A9W6X951_9STRA|nr:unnamed protein product [Phytophthora lilii]
MRFPLPADTFPTLSLPLDDQDALKNLTAAFVEDALVEYRAFRSPPLNGAVDDTRWKLIKKRDGVMSYLDRELGDPAATRNSVRESVGSMSFSRKLHGVLTVGTIDGTLHDQMYGMHHCSMELMRIKSAYMDDKIADGKILSEMCVATPENPVSGLYIKWSVSDFAPALLRRVIRPRDFVFLDGTGIVEDEASGEKIGYSVMHSLQIPGIRELTEYQIVRATLSICALFRQKSPGVVEVYMKGFVDSMGDIHTNEEAQLAAQDQENRHTRPTKWGLRHLPEYGEEVVVLRAHVPGLHEPGVLHMQRDAKAGLPAVHVAQDCEEKLVVLRSLSDLTCFVNFRDRCPAEHVNAVVHIAATQSKKAPSNSQQATEHACLLRTWCCQEKVGSGAVTASTKLHGVLAVGTVDGEFNDMAFGLLNGDTEIQKIKSSYTNDKIADAKVLATIVEPTPTEPFQGTYIKWSVSVGPIAVLRKRADVLRQARALQTNEEAQLVVQDQKDGDTRPRQQRLRRVHEHSAATKVLPSMFEHHVLSLQHHEEAQLPSSWVTSSISAGLLPRPKRVPAATMPSSEGDADDVLEIRDDEASDDSSSLSSYDSEEFGLVARKGFARMYVLSRNMPSSADEKDSKGESSLKQGGWSLLYASGQHYFHGPIDLPEDIQVREEVKEDPVRPVSFFESITRQHEGGVELADIPRLLPLLHAQQDSLTAVDDVTELTSGQRDAVYQMLEVGEFFVEELAKPRTTERLERGAQELPWLSEATENNNPAFFELQTHPNTNNDLANAGVRLVVMKLVVRGVLLDIVYSRDSYFVTLRDNADEIALDDTFVPNGRKTCCTTSSARKASSPGGKSRRVLTANDTQLYCLIAKRPQARKNAAKKKKSSGTRGKDSKRVNDDGDADDESGDVVDDAVVFQFNQFVYHGSAQLPTTMLDDPGALSACGFPLLRAQASDLAFAGVYEEILGPGGEHEADNPRTKFLSRFATVHRRFQEEIGSVLLELLVGAQKWVGEFMAEVPAASGGNSLIATHLARWLEVEDGSESFFELELARGSICPFAQVVDEDHAYGEQQPLDLMVWKGIVHDALLGIVYRRGSFYMTLQPIAESSDVVSDGVLDDDASAQLFAGLPPHLNKGRGYLVRRLPSTAGTPAWLAGAKLLLWQTSLSLEREEQDEAQIQASECKTPCKDWFEDSEAKTDGRTAAKAQSKPHALRPVELADDKLSSVSTAPRKADKVARPHHVSRLSSSEALLALQAKALATLQPVPWDLRTGRPI